MGFPDSHQRAEQFRHSAAARRGVDVPHDPPLEAVPGPLGGALEPLPLLFRQHRPEALERRAPDLNLAQRGHRASVAKPMAAMASTVSARPSAPRGSSARSRERAQVDERLLDPVAQDVCV